MRRVAAAVALLLLVSACGSGRDRPLAPYAGAALFVAADSDASRQQQAWRAAGETARADAIQPLVDAPTAVWLTGQEPDATAAALRVTVPAEQAVRWPVLVVYDVPGRDCGHYSAGGAADPQAYFSFVGQVAAGVGRRPAIVILEPDAVAQAVTGCPGLDTAERFGTLATAVDILTEQTDAQVYVDAGHAGWVADLDGLAAGLRASGIEKVAGFSLNVSNFQTTEATVAYGDRLSERLDDRPYVIDTSRNGAGPPPADLDENWCNPPGRRIGAAPTTRPEASRVDALLWIKPPGASDGPCRGYPPAGAWSGDLALDLVGSR